MRKKKYYLKVDYREHFGLNTSPFLSKMISRTQREILEKKIIEIRKETNYRNRENLKIKFFLLYYKYKQNLSKYYDM